MFDCNLKVVAIGGGFGKIDTYKKFTKSVLLVEIFTELECEGK